jgi:YfiH family protein
MQFFTHASLGTSHGFFGRDGGVSQGIYAGLNCGPGSNDDPAAIAENRRRAAQALGFEELSTLYQIHSADVLTLDKPLQDERPQADAMVTKTPGLLLGILTADCAPVLFSDKAARVIGAAHAGWKGACSGVLENTVRAMEALGAKKENIAAAIGPCIGQKSYEVGQEFVDRLLEADPANSVFFGKASRTGHAMFDLPGYVLSRLRAAGLRQIAVLGMDTLSDEQQFFSYRRTTLVGQKDYGRQLSAIGLME